jgi:hypothetical protein
MALNGVAVAYSVIGGLVLYSGIKGATIADTVKAVISGNLGSVTNTEAITSGTSTGVSSSGDVSGTASQNYILIANFLVGNGYSKAAAAGIVACIAGESSGNPEAVGDQGTSFGLIQEHGSQYSGLVTGNASKDLQAQLEAILAYNNAQGSQLIAMLNQITDPVQAADFYSQHFERPAVTNSDVVASVAKTVYAQIQSSSAPTG